MTFFRTGVIGDFPSQEARQFYNIRKGEICSDSEWAQVHKVSCGWPSSGQTINWLVHACPCTECVTSVVHLRAGTLGRSVCPHTSVGSASDCHDPSLGGKS